jgi:hypothetical protein
MTLLYLMTVGAPYFIRARLSWLRCRKGFDTPDDPSAVRYAALISFPICFALRGLHAISTTLGSGEVTKEARSVRSPLGSSDALSPSMCRGNERVSRINLCTIEESARE